MQFSILSILNLTINITKEHLLQEILVYSTNISQMLVTLVKGKQISFLNYFNTTYLYSLSLKSQSIQSIDSFFSILGVNIVHKTITQALA